MITKHLAQENYTRIDNDLFKLSNDAYCLYGYYCNVHPNKDPNDKYMQEITGIKFKKFFSAKRELKNNGYIYVQQVGKKDYIYHVGKLAVMKIKSKKK